MKSHIYLLYIVLFFVSCGKSRIPDGYYVNKDATAFTCKYFQVKGDTLYWSNDFRKAPKAFVYKLSGGELQGRCIEEDERMIKKYAFVNDSIIIEDQMFVPFSPSIEKLPEGKYENYMSVPLRTLRINIYGDSIEYSSYRYDERKQHLRNKFYLKDDRTLVMLRKDGKKMEYVFMPLYDGFILDEDRFVKLD